MRNTTPQSLAMRRLLLFLFLPVVFLLPHPVRAQKLPTPYPNEVGALYIGDGQELAEMPPRLLTKNERVIDFICSPVGNKVAFYSAIKKGDSTVGAVGVATLETGQETIYYRVDETQFESDDGPTEYLNGLYGWADDSSYLAFGVGHYTPDPSQPRNGTYASGLEFVDMVRGSVLDMPLPLDQVLPPTGSPSDSDPGTLKMVDVGGPAWAPGVRLFAFDLDETYTKAGRVYCVCVCDPDRRTSRLLAQSTNTLYLEGWQDSSHLVYKTGGNHFLYDLATGKSSPWTQGSRKLARAVQDFRSETSVITPDKQRLELTETIPPIPSGIAQIDETDGTATVWISRDGGPPKLSKLALDDFLGRAGTNEVVQFEPNGGFDREGVYHVVYLADDDLKVVDLLTRAATPEEKYAAGEKLTCEEEIPIVEREAGEMAQGILRWARENGGALPGADGFHDKIAPYIASDQPYASPFTSPNGEPFHYLPPADRKVADMNDRADMPLGEFDLPCAKVVLYCNGYPKVQYTESGG